MYGYMPAKTTIFNARAVATHSFNLGPRNTIIFSPHGRFVLVAGFGNLAGQMDIYDLEKDYNKVCTIEASNASVCEWSPDGKHILTATTSPRLRVDNGIRIYHVGGGVMYNEEMTELYHVVWRPQSDDKHPLENPLHPIPTPHPSALTYLATKKTPSKPAGAYRPPGARGTTTPLAFKREDEGGAAYVSNGISSNGPSTNGFGRARTRYVPGAEPADQAPLPPGAAPGGGVSLTGLGEGDQELSAAAKKNKKKREAKKAKEAAEKASALNPDGENANGASHGRSASRSPERRPRRQTHGERSRERGPNSRQQSRQRGPGRPRNATQTGPQQQPQMAKFDVSAAAVPSEAPDLTVTSPGGGVSPEDKKVRSLLKKIRAIEDLKMRQAGGEKLEDTQIKKIQTEEGIRKQLEAVGKTS